MSDRRLYPCEPGESAAVLCVPARVAAEAERLGRDPMIGPLNPAQTAWMMDDNDTGWLFFARWQSGSPPYVSVSIAKVYARLECDRDTSAMRGRAEWHS